MLRCSPISCLQLRADQRFFARVVIGFRRAVRLVTRSKSKLLVSNSPGQCAIGHYDLQIPGLSSDRTRVHLNWLHPMVAVDVLETLWVTVEMRGRPMFMQVLAPDHLGKYQTVWLGILHVIEYIGRGERI